MAHEVFISHSSEDKATADLVCNALEEAGMSCWIAPRDVRPGKFFPGEIKRAIERCRVMVLIFSAHSNRSDHVLREIDFATRAHASIVNFRIENVALSDDLDYFLALPHWLDALTPPTKACLAQLTGSVRGLLDLPPKGPALPANPDDSTVPPPAAASAVFVAPEPPAAPASAGRAALREQRRGLARTFTDAALRETEGVGFRAVDDFQLLEPLIRVLARAGDGPSALRAATETGGGFKDFALGMVAEDAGARRRPRRSPAHGRDVPGKEATSICRMARAMAESRRRGCSLAAGRRKCQSAGVAVLRSRARGALSEIAEAQAKAGDVNGALHTVASIDVSSPDRLAAKGGAAVPGGDAGAHCRGAGAGGRSADGAANAHWRRWRNAKIRRAGAK